MSSFQENLAEGNFLAILSSPLARTTFGHDEVDTLRHLEWENFGDDWSQFIHERASLLIDASDHNSVGVLQDNLFSIGVAALNAFLQSNVTGPPLSWISNHVILPQILRHDFNRLKAVRRQMILGLSVDGETVYKLTPRVELFSLAKLLLNHEKIIGKSLAYVWGRLRVNFWHQRMLNENVDSLQKTIYDDLKFVERSIPNESPKTKAEFLVERATIHTHHGFDVKAREDLTSAAKKSGLEYVLTGRLGKRTKFQQNELSQLVVLAKSTSYEASQKHLSDQGRSNGVSNNTENERAQKVPKPLNLDLNDDTLLEAISFSREPPTSAISVEEDIPTALKTLDPADQPTLLPLDSIILLAFASSISNTSPQHGLTREETLPYATRVLSGGSTNWQVYTQALLVRSRIEGYRSRTVERGVLQLQAVVDQVIAETEFPTSSDPATDAYLESSEEQTSSTTFLPKPKASESAPVSERLLYIHQLASPTRWKLEAELADRWVSLGGLRTALEIYERLQMWAEVALCWAASDRENEARKIICNQLYESSSIDEDIKDTERGLLPADAPRLLCILGDIDKSPAAYERAWEVSNFRYARAQRSLGRYYVASHDLQKARDAYRKSLKISPQHHDTWFALGSVNLQLEDWMGAVDAFGRAIQIEETDAESWSNLAAGLLRLPSTDSLEKEQANKVLADDDEDKDMQSAEANPQKHTQEAFVALKRAAVLKRESYRIWQNLLNVAVRLSPLPYTDIIIAQTRLIELLSNVEGEKCVDIDVVEGLVTHLISSSSSPQGQPDPTKSYEKSETSFESNPTEAPLSRKTGFSKMVIDLVQKKITPLITTSRRLWLLTAKLSLHLNHLSATLSAYEKAWRVTINQPGWESGAKGAEKAWKEVADATVELADAYESLGERKREAGMGEGELVCKEWRFKARSAVRGILGRAKEGWAGTGEFEVLERRMGELKSA